MKGPTRNCHIEIDPAALKHNLARVRQFAPDSRVMPVIKANAYGHGVEAVARALDDADSFAVAMIGEAVALRELGCDKPIVVFHGFGSAEELELVARYQLQATVHDPGQLDLLDDYRGEALKLWLKLDTGMHRLGVPLAQAVDCYRRMERVDAIEQVRLMSHFANADDPDNPMNISQLENLLKVKSDIGDSAGCELSMANSAALVSLPESRLDWVRPGIMLYGASPLLQTSAASLGLRPAMRFSSSLLSLRYCRAGERIGYGSTWECPEDMPLGLVAAGYGDGYPRHAASGTPVMVNGQSARLVGRVSMDSVYVDLRCVDAEPGDEVELWGEHVPVDTVAAHSATIAYELTCNAGRCQGALAG